MPSGSIELEIDKESYDKTYQQLSTLYQIAFETSRAMDTTKKHAARILVFIVFSFLFGLVAGFALALLVIPTL